MWRARGLARIIAGWLSVVSLGSVDPPGRDLRAVWSDRCDGPAAFSVRGDTLLEPVETVLNSGESVFDDLTTHSEQAPQIRPRVRCRGSAGFAWREPVGVLASGESGEGIGWPTERSHEGLSSSTSSTSWGFVLFDLADERVGYVRDALLG